jgi:anti-sigma-K factor RskA
MSCAEAEELLGAYALDALPDDEAAAFRAHVATCAEHASKASELRAVASTLADAPAGAAAVGAAPLPEALRARVLSAVAREPQIAATAAPRRIETAPSAGAARTSEPKTPFWRSVRPLQIWGGLAAAIIAALVIWNIALRADDDGSSFDATQATSIAALEAHDANGAGTALYFADEASVVLVADGIDQLDDTQTYQLWALTGDAPVSLGVMRPDADGHMSSVAPFDASTASGIAITVEPAGGSPQPTSDPVFTAELRS